MSDLPGNDRLPPGCLPSDIDPPERPGEAWRDEVDAWWDSWVKRRQKEDQ